MLEARSIQHRIQQRKRGNNNNDNNNTCRLFTKLMFEGRVKEALRLLSTKEKGTPLNIHSAVSSSNPHHTVLNELQAKHPPGQPTTPNALLHSPPSPPPCHPVIFDQLQGSSIRSAALHTSAWCCWSIWP